MIDVNDYKDELLDAIVAGDVEDIISDLADSALPVYTADLVEVWLRVPTGIGEELYSEMTVDHLMTCDVYVYYSNLLRDYVEELTEDYELGEY